jgi:hypothetical protein
MYDIHGIFCRRWPERSNNPELCTASEQLVAMRRIAMIFVSYSHEDEKWRKRFEVLSKPLSRAENIKFWSDRDLKAGEWEKQIERAMEGAVAAVLMVSDNFVASDYVIEKELPYLLRAYDSGRLMVFWAYLEPCDLKRHPEITRFQAMTLGNLEPMAKMTDWQWKATMLCGCDMIDEYLKSLEQPILNRSITKKPFPRVATVPLLAKPSRRDIEVLIYGGNKWWRQAPIKAGSIQARIHIGDDRTAKGAAFPIIAITTDAPLTRQTYPNLPNHRRKSDEIILRRA